MKMFPVPQSGLEALVPFFEPIVSEMNLTDRINVREWMEMLGRGYITKTTDVYVDSIQNPQHCLVLCRNFGGVDRGIITVVRLIYSKPEVRSDADAVAVMMKTIHAYAEIHDSNIILASSWKFKGSRPIDSLWIGNGFEVQETTYVKML